MFRTTLLAALTAAAFTPALAGPAPLAEWVDTVNGKIHRVMFTPVSGDAQGRVTLTFRRGADGRATDVSVVDAASPGVRYAARRTVSRLRNLPVLPAGIDQDALIRVQLLYGTDDGPAFYAMRTQMLAAARVANDRLAMRIGSTQLAANSEPR